MSGVVLVLIALMLSACASEPSDTLTDEEARERFKTIITEVALTPQPSRTPTPPQMHIYDMVLVSDSLIAVTHRLRYSDGGEELRLSFFEIGKDGETWFVTERDDINDLTEGVYGRYLELSDDGRYLIVAPWEDDLGVVFILDTETWETVYTAESATHAMMYEDTVIVAGDKIQFIDIESGTVERTLELPYSFLVARSLYYDGERLVMPAVYVTFVWGEDDDTPTEIQTQPISEIMRLGDEVMLATNEGVQIVDTLAGSIKHQFVAQHFIVRADMSSDNQWLAGYVYVPPDPQPTRVPRVGPGTLSPPVLPSVAGRNLYIFRLDEDMNPIDSDILRSSRSASFLGVSFTADNKYLITAETDSDLRIWDYKEQVEVARFYLRDSRGN